ncbi:MAG: UDP-N-acetylmuramoyl-L-alanyl-D-glutamate--2,6-diaminopimelate ligase [Pseudomonadota bacterium]|nr:UDP-N-acetylmuramoyl-L-alanyl-D-glutamate--2,6-diaminopimelate ligase [Pseudomonadota bacterium]
MSKSVWTLLPSELRASLLEHESLLSALLVNGLSSDSRQVKSGDLFFAVPGTQMDGRTFAKDALDKGAQIVITEDQSIQHPFYDSEEKLLLLPLLAPWIGIIAAEFYDWPSKKMKLVGITGTNGKTTTSFLIASLGESLGLKTAVMGTNGYGPLSSMKTQALTTPDPITLQKQLAELQQDGVELVAMEVSSHSLVQYRVNGCLFDTAVVTNISRDHLDYHGDIESYARAKALLVTWSGLKHAVINRDDDYAELFLNYSQAKKNWIYGYCATEKELPLPPQSILCKIRLQEQKQGKLQSLELDLGQHYSFATALIGRFNYQNLCAALLTYVAAGYELKALESLVPQLALPQGRMETVNDYETEETLAAPRVVVDFAHTPDAMDVVLTELKLMAEGQQGKLFVVFGCGGDRDRGKRPLMAAVAEKYADAIIVTRDNPRHESSEQIFEDIYKGFSKALIKNTKDVVMRCDSRSEAIAIAIKKAASNDVVAILGKGHEKYQEIAGQRTDFDDVETARLAIQNAKKPQ